MAREEGYQKNILTAALSVSMGMRIAIAVDDDINMYEAEDVLWAIATRAEPDKDIQVVAPGSRGQVFQPAQIRRGEERVARAVGYAGGLAIDATVPFEMKWAFERPLHHRVDLKKWFSEAQIQKAKEPQWSYHKFLSESGI